MSAYGSTGPIPAGGPDASYRVIAILNVDSPKGLAAVSVRDVSVFGDSGEEASLRQVESVERLPLAAPLTPVSLYETGDGRPFDGTLRAGTTRLRVRARLSDKPRSRAPAIRIVIGNGAMNATATAMLGGEWPTAGPAR